MSFGFNFCHRGNYRICRNYWNCRNYGNYGRYQNQNFVGHICDYIGETVTIFTTSGGASGCGFTGILFAVNCDYCKLTTRIGSPPANPLSENICPDLIGCGGPGGSDCYNNDYRGLGSVVDIPLCKIAAFCHNAV